MQQRGLVPTVIENAIKHGTRTASDIPGRIICRYENVLVIIEGVEEIVITVIKKGH